MKYFNPSGHSNPTPLEVTGLFVESSYDYAIRLFEFSLFLWKWLFLSGAYTDMEEPRVLFVLVCVDFLIVFVYFINTLSKSPSGTRGHQQVQKGL